MDCGGEGVTTCTTRPHPSRCCTCICVSFVDELGQVARGGTGGLCIKMDWHDKIEGGRAEGESLCIEIGSLVF